MKTVTYILAIAILSSYTLGQDFYGLTACPNFDNDKYVKGLDLKFSLVPPTQGEPEWVTASGTSEQDFFVSYINAVIKLNGITLWKGN